MKKFILSIFILFSLLSSQTIYAEVLSGSGIVPGQIWYSKNSLIEGENVNIHTAIWNDNEYPISTKVEFYDGDILLGVRDVSVKSNELKNVYISWKVTVGDHIISAKISSSLNPDNKEKVSLSRVSTISSKNSVSKIVKNDEGEVVNITNEIKDKIEEVVPQSIQTTVSDKINILENIRLDNSQKISELKNEVKNDLDIFKKDKKEKMVSSDKSLEDSIKEPLIYVKLFFLSILNFIFGSKLVFYGFLVFVIFLLLRFIYRKIRNK